MHPVDMQKTGRNKPDIILVDPNLFDTERIATYEQLILQTPIGYNTGDNDQCYCCKHSLETDFKFKLVKKDKSRECSW
jgi:hypothetical protein